MTTNSSVTAYHAPKYFWGVDCGSAAIKVVVLDAQGKLIAKSRRRTLFPLTKHVNDALSGAAEGLSPFTEDGALAPQHRVTATGYGRNHLEFASARLTEIKAHFLGVNAQQKHTVDGASVADYAIIDIGGQDAKVVKVLAGKVSEFAINRKCAAGTGAFIEELAHRLEVPLSELTTLARAHDKDVTLNSYCTVFSGQEVIKILMNGERIENLIYALYRSVVKRVLEMTAIEQPRIVFSGGVMAHHPILVELFAQKLPERDLAVADDPQYCGAVGAALFGIEEELKHGVSNHR